MFDDGVFELATRTRDGRSEWYALGTYKPGAVKLLRRTMTCCVASHPASECFGQQLLSEATACEAKRGCAAFDTCIQQRLEKRRAKACKPPAHEDCFL